MISKILTIQLIFLLFFLYSDTNFSYAWEFPFEFWEDTVDSQTNFVKIPTKTGNYTGVFVGVVTGGLICFPAGVIAAPFTNGESIGEYVYKGGFIGGGILMHTTGFVFGAPFYVIEKCFWDFPNWLVSSKEEDIDE